METFKATKFVAHADGSGGYEYRGWRISRYSGTSLPWAVSLGKFRFATLKAAKRHIDARIAAKEQQSHETPNL